MVKNGNFTGWFGEIDRIGEKGIKNTKKPVHICSEYQGIRNINGNIGLWKISVCIQHVLNQRRERES